MSSLTCNNVTMSLENQLGSDGFAVALINFQDQTELITLSNSTIEQRKFSVPFQFGFDGQNPTTHCMPLEQTLTVQTHKDLI